MKHRITFFFLEGLAVGVAALLAHNAQSQNVLYNNTGGLGGTSAQAGDFTYAGTTAGTSSGEIGNEVVLKGGTAGAYTGQADYISSFEVQYFLNGTTFSGSSPEVTLNFYQMTGPVTANSAGQPTPVQIFTDGPFPLSAFTANLSGPDQTLTWTLPNIAVPADFTWTIAFSGIGASGMNAGMSIFNGPTQTISGHSVPVPAVGGNYNDAWQLSGGNWSLQQSGSGIPAGVGLQFGTLIEGTAVPEPSTIALGVIGACTLLARRRKS